GNRLDKLINGIVVEVYDWDIQGELAGATITEDGTTTNINYQYNTDGIRVGQTVNGEETRFLIDANQQEFAQVIEEYTPGSIIQVAYTHGNDLISQHRGTEKGFYHTDSLGSVRLLTDALGNVANTYVYDPYGSVTNQSELQQNAYRFTGEQFDPELGNYYLRARYYNPATGRFVSRDPFEGILRRPLSLNDYPYAEGNPVNAIDPTGEVPVIVYAALAGAAIAVAGRFTCGTFITGNRPTGGDLVRIGILGAVIGVVNVVLGSLGLSFFSAVSTGSVTRSLAAGGGVSGVCEILNQV
ncbi:MAG: RHS repeat-associated core domain-containing protein, partial [Cyanobacteria bacterium J06559_3]